MRKTRTKKAPGPAYRIKFVTFRSSVQIKDFQHAHVEISAEVLPGGDPQKVLDSLKTWVATELQRAKEGEVPSPRVGQFRV